MAVFQNLLSHRRIVLRPLHAFGRYAAACQTVMRSAEVSQTHARVRWDGQQWALMDQSRNGTTLNGRRLPSGVWTTLEVGALVRMGTDDETAWTVINIDAPQTCLVSLDGGGEPIPLYPQGTLLPDDNQPVAEIHCREGHWLVEYPEGLDHLVDGAAVRIDESTWEFVLCPVLQETLESHIQDQARPATREIALHFDVSLDEEHTELRLQHEDVTVDLGERIHHYTLLTLARRRLDDSQRGLDAAAQGWVSVDQLARMLGVEPGYVNIQLFRAKHQINGALPVGFELSPLTERRRGEVRFGDNAFTIRRGATVEGSAPKQESRLAASAPTPTAS